MNIGLYDAYPLIDCLIDWFIRNWVRALTVRMHLGLKNRSFVPHNLVAFQGRPVPSLKLQMAPRRKLLMSSGSKKKESRYTCLSEANASHSQRMWGEVSHSAPHRLHKTLLVSPVKWRCLLTVLCPVKWSITLCPIEGEKSGLCSRTSARNHFSSLSLSMCFHW